MFSACRLYMKYQSFVVLCSIFLEIKTIHHASRWETHHGELKFHLPTEIFHSHPGYGSLMHEAYLVLEMNYHIFSDFKYFD